MLRVYILNFGGSWKHYLRLVEFAYNNSCQESKKKTPFEELYGGSVDHRFIGMTWNEESTRTRDDDSDDRQGHVICQHMNVVHV